MLSPNWDCWAAAERDLEELRWEYGIAPVLPADAAGGPEVVVTEGAPSSDIDVVFGLRR